MMEKLPRVLSIAGSAAGGSAGIQADLKTFQELDVFGMSTITAIVGRHPKTEKNVHPLTIEAIEGQLHTAHLQTGVDVVKTGMLFSKEVIETVTDFIKKHHFQHVVVDPVMVGKMKSKLLKDDAIVALKEKLIPLATIITPNMIEASILLDDRPVNTEADIRQAAIDLYHLSAKHVLVKGGRLEGPAIDCLYNGHELVTVKAPRIHTENTSGAGCTYSAAIAAFLAKGYTTKDAVIKAKSFVTTAIEHSFSYTGLVGPTYHAAERNFGEAHPIEVQVENI